MKSLVAFIVVLGVDIVNVVVHIIVLGVDSVIMGVGIMVLFAAIASS